MSMILRGENLRDYDSFFVRIIDRALCEVIIFDVFSVFSRVLFQLEGFEFFLAIFFELEDF